MVGKRHQPTQLSTGSVPLSHAQTASGACLLLLCSLPARPAFNCQVARTHHTNHNNNHKYKNHKTVQVLSSNDVNVKPRRVFRRPIPVRPPPPARNGYYVRVCVLCSPLPSPPPLLFSRARR